MKLIKIIPGPLLVFLGAFCLSFGGLIVKSFESANLWQILFWRQTFFAIIVALYLLVSYKKNIFKSFYNSGLSGFIGGFILSIGFSAYVFAMYNTTIANTNFIITTETIFLAVFGYFLLKEKINLGLDIGSSDVLSEFSNKTKPRNFSFSIGSDLLKNALSFKKARNGIFKILNNKFTS